MSNRHSWKEELKAFLYVGGPAFAVLMVGAVGVALFNTAVPAHLQTRWVAVAPAGAVILTAQIVAYVQWRKYTRPEELR